MGMTEQEAVKNALNGLRNADVRIVDEIRYPSIKALEKQIAKKPTHEPFYGGRCVVCNGLIPNKQVNYCSKCGQKLDWGNEDAE